MGKPAVEQEPATMGGPAAEVGSAPFEDPGEAKLQREDQLPWEVQLPSMTSCHEKTNCHGRPSC